MPRPAVYLRVSTEMQRERVSIRSQEDALSRWLEAQGYDPDEDIIWYRDDGVSGETPITLRGDGARLVADIKAGVVGGFVATFSVSRISREASDFFAFRRLLSDHNLVLIGVSEGASTGDEGGDMAVSINALFADWSNKALRKASKSGLMRGAREGKWMTRQPFGYRVENRHLVIYEPQATIVRDIFRWYTDHKRIGVSVIARRLNDLKIPSPAGANWQTNTVLRILHNPLYMGQALYNRATTRNNKRQGVKPPSEYITIPTPAIVSAELFATAQKILARSGKANAKTGKYHALCLLNRVKCAVCGRNYYRAGNGRGRQGYYRHDAYNRNDKSCANAALVNSETVDKQAWEKTINAIRNPSGWMHELEQSQVMGGDERKELAQTEQAIAMIIAQLERLEEAYVVHGTMTGERYAQLAKELRTKEDRLRLRAYELKQSVQSTELQAKARQSTAAQMHELRHYAENATNEERALVMDILIEAVILDVTGETPTIRVKWA